MQILVLLGMYFDAVVVFVTSQTLLFRLALAILCDITYHYIVKDCMTFRTSRNIRTLMSINWNGFCYVSLCHKTKRPNLQFPDGCKYTLKLTLELMWLTSHMTLVTQPMLQCWPNWTKLRLMVSIFKFYVDSKNVSERFLLFFFQIFS